MSTISINKFLANIDFKQVAYIEAVSSENAPESSERGVSETKSAVHFIGSSTLLTGQTRDYFQALAHGRVLSVPSEAETTERIIPLDAIHHFELRSEDGSDGCALGGDHEMAKPDDAVVVYRVFDPECSEQRFQMPVPPAVIDDLLDRDDGAALIDIGNGRFVFAGDIEDARPLKAWQIARLAGEPSSDEIPWEPPVTILELKGGEFIQSSFYARTIEGMVGRPLPSAISYPSRHRSAQPSDESLCA